MGSEDMKDKKKLRKMKVYYLEVPIKSNKEVYH